MAIKVTRLQDVFKQKVKESMHVPTIWRDSNGEEHEDFEAINIRGAVPVGGHIGTYFCPESTYTRFPGLILQVGSHVKSCYYIGFCGDSTLDEKIPENLFKYATSLEELDMTFAFKKFKDIPPDLFASCAQLETLRSVFYCCKELKSIPSELFSHNSLLKNIPDCFSECSELTEVPNGFFDNNPNLYNLMRSFFRCIKLTTIPSGLFDPLAGKQVYLGEMFNFCIVQSIPEGLFKPLSPKSGFEYLFGHNKWSTGPIDTEFSEDKVTFIEKYFPDGVDTNKLLGHWGIFENP